MKIVPLARPYRTSQKKVVTPDQQLAAADYLSERYRVSQRRISRVMARSRSILRYRCSSATDVH